MVICSYSLLICKYCIGALVKAFTREFLWIVRISDIYATVQGRRHGSQGPSRLQDLGQGLLLPRPCLDFAGFIYGNSEIGFRFFVKTCDEQLKCFEIPLMAVQVVEFSSGGTKLERFFHWNQQAQSKLLNF